MRAVVVVVVDEFTKQSPKVFFVQHNDVVEQLTPGAGVVGSRPLRDFVMCRLTVQEPGVLRLM